MKIIQLTDIHLTTPGQTIGGRDSNANFERALAHALNDHSDAELVVITGDLSDWGDRDDYVRLKEIIERQPIPVKLCIGNHDDRKTFQQVFTDYTDENGFAQTMTDVSAGRCLFLDTWGPETHAGYYCETRSNWLDRQLNTHDGPFFLFMHHNPMPSHLGALDQIRLLDDVPFRALVAKHKSKIRHIFFGHCHLPLSGSVSGIPASSLRSTNHQGYPNFKERNLLTNSNLPEAYSVAFIAPDYVTVLMVEYGYDGDIRIEASPDYALWNRATMKR
jgi:3',5'-cyclic AMP phosphodiesterase CpdA